VMPNIMRVKVTGDMVMARSAYRRVGGNAGGLTAAEADGPFAAAGAGEVEAGREVLGGGGFRAGDAGHEGHAEAEGAWLYYLPPDSPELTRIEEPWPQVKYQDLPARSYRTLTDLRTAVEDALGMHAAHPLHAPATLPEAA
jgi:hypothetical protein